MSLRVDHIAFAYGPRSILRATSCTFPAGDVTGIVGRNGVGKSTLLQLCAGLLTPAAGTIWWQDRRLSSLTLRERAMQCAYVPQRMHTPFVLTVEEFVLLGRLPYRQGVGRTSMRDRAVVDTLLAQFELRSLATQPIQQLSGGEWQRAQLARALAQEPRLLLLDEPCTHLDLRHQHDVMRDLRTCARDLGMTIGCTMHDLSLTTRYCDHVVLLHDERVLQEGPPAEVLTPVHIHTALGVEPADV